MLGGSSHGNSCLRICRVRNGLCIPLPRSALSRGRNTSVVVKRDKFFVMGTDEKDLFRYASMAAFAIQTRPWRWEVDLCKNFVNVDLGFVEELDERWLE